jgi:hypothetical protein
MCVLAARPPDQPLASYERRVAAHVAMRAGVSGEVLAPALWDGFAIEASTWSWRRGIVVLLVIIGAPGAYVYALIWMFSNGMTGLATDAAWLVPLAVFVSLIAWAAARSWFPQFTEFNGQVIRQWLVKGGEDSPDQYHVAVDDGIRDQAWDFDVGIDAYQRLPPDTFVHVRVNLRNRSQLSVDPVEPPPRLW